ncbi:MAG TPA: ATP-binding protein, partial [Chitinophagaceae bacterium]|nr:ATP-binding protein [Chitinophagaceae bacterium]
GSVATCITEDHAHTVWASTAYTLCQVSDGRLQFRQELFPRIEGRSIESITEAQPGMLWIATRKGLYAFDIARKRMNDKPLLADVYARNIFRAKDGSIWVGTYGNGYYKYAQGTFVALPLDPQKYLANTHAFLEDDNGFFWLTTNHGLFKLRKADLDSFVISRDIKDVYFYYFDKSYGFNTNEFNGGCNPAALKDSAGNFYFPSLSGIVYFNPSRVPAELPVNDIYIDRFHVGGRDLDYTKPIKIKPDFDQVFVDVATPFFGLDDNLNLVYKLNTLGQKWYPVPADGRIVINRLPYGNYSLIIRKREGWGRNKFTTANISFEVLPYWYNTGWFYGSLLALVLLLGFGLFKIRTRILLRQNLRLQEKVDERTYELNQSTIMKEKLISVIVHDLRSPLASHSFLVNYLYDHLGKIPVNTMEELFFQLKESSDRISHFSKDFLTWYNSQMQGWMIKRTVVVLDEFLVQVVSFYKEMALRKNIGFECQVAPGLVLQTDEYILSIVVRNLVDNAVKYTRSGGIKVLAFREKDSIHIQVKDTGQGMPASRVQELLEYVDIDTSKAKPTFGYLFILEFTRKLGGKIVIESEPEKGTTVTVMLASL